MPQDNCDTGRVIFKTRGEATAFDAELTGDDVGEAERCHRCRGWHAKRDRPRSRRLPRRPRR